MIKSKNIKAEYIKEKLSKSKIQLLFKKVPVTVIGDINQNLSIQIILNSIEKILVKPSFIENIENIYFGDFKFLADRSIQALYADNCVYISSFVNSKDITNTVVIKDVLHEIGHSIEDSHSLSLYGDKRLEYEFLSKKNSLLKRLVDIGYLDSTELYDGDSEYSVEYDKFLYSEVGYQNLEMVTSRLYLSPYSATSLSEYFANGFEQYFAGSQRDIKELCPTLYIKIKDISKKLSKG